MDCSSLSIPIRGVAAAVAAVAVAAAAAVGAAAAPRRYLDSKSLTAESLVRYRMLQLLSLPEGVNSLLDSP